MQVMAQAFALDQSGHKRCIDDGRFERSQAHAEVAIHMVEIGKQSRKVLIQRGIDPGQNELFEPGFDQIAAFAQDILAFPAAHGAARRRDLTVRAVPVAALFDLDIGAGLAVRRGDLAGLHELVEILPRIDADHLFFRLPGCSASCAAGTSCKAFFHHVHDLIFVIGPQQNIEFLDLPERFRLGLHIASRCSDDRILVGLFHPTDVLPGLAVRQPGHGTGIDHVNIGGVCLADDLIAARLKEVLHGLCFILVDTASQRMECDSFLFHVLILSSPAERNRTTCRPIPFQRLLFLLLLSPYLPRRG